VIVVLDIRCSACGIPVAPDVRVLQQFECIDDVGPSGALQHPECVIAAAQRRFGAEDEPDADVLLYSAHPGPLTG
jgi:hypothetical protein